MGINQTPRREASAPYADILLALYMSMALTIANSIIGLLAYFRFFYTSIALVLLGFHFPCTSSFAGCAAQVDASWMVSSD